METPSMNLKILLPFKVYSETRQVVRIVAETSGGSYGFLPQRLDCVASLVPGILEYETDARETIYLGVDEGILIKTGSDVFVSVHHAIGGADLDELHEAVQKEFMNLDESERNVSAVMSKMSNSLIHSLEKYLKG